MPSIFLSHSWRDKFFVRELAERLKERGVSVWLDEAELKVGDSLIEKIGKAIDQVDFVAVVLSHNSVNSEWVQTELRIALQKELSNRRIVVLPLLLDPVDVPAFLRDKVYADFTSPDKFEKSFRSLLGALGISPKRIKPPSQEVVPTPLPLEPRVVAYPARASAAQTAAARRLADFEDVRIVGLDDGQSYNPDPSKALYNMYLELSAPPPVEWQKIFEAERRFPRHTMWRRAWIEGQYVIVYCVPEELEQYHKTDLEEDVRNSNSKFRQYLTELAQKEARETRKEQDEREHLAALARRLKFD